jgi:hypothetical protein
MPSFIPVDYDPFMGAAEAAPKLFPTDQGPFGSTTGAPSLIPVDHAAIAGASTPNLIPVDHDPFADNPAAAPRLIPVDYDPFDGAASAAPNFIPVDHDPFADNPGAAPKLIPVDYDPFAVLAPVGDASQPAYSDDTSPFNSTSASPSRLYGKFYPATSADLETRLANQNSSPAQAPMQSQSPDELAQNLSPYCRKIKALCIDRCIDSLPTLDYGFKFWNCVSDCMASFGCPSVRGP